MNIFLNKLADQLITKLSDYISAKIYWYNFLMGLISFY